MNRKTIRSIVFSAALTLIYACGGPNQEADSSNTKRSKTEISTPPVDIAAKNDSNGVGSFSSVTLEPINPSEAKKGELIFSSQCASCHALTEARLLGPGLKGITVRRTPEWILNMIVNPEENLKKEPLGKALIEEYKTIMPDFGVSDEEAVHILAFLRQNDKQ